MMLDQGLPLCWGREKDSDEDVREVTVCSCGEDGCGHSRCRVRVDGDTVIFEDFAGEVTIRTQQEENEAEMAAETAKIEAELKQEGGSRA